MIGVISLNNASSEARAMFTKNKLEKYGCTALNGRSLKHSNEDAEFEEGYDEEGLSDLIKKVSR